MRICRIKEFAVDLLSGAPKCSCCGELLEINYPFPLCRDCMKKWNEGVKKPCTDCGKPRGECICRPFYSSNIEDYVYLASYYEESCQSMIREFKKLNNRRIAAFLGAELAFVIKMRFPDFRNKPVIVNVPRSRRSVFTYGHDQAAVLAKETASALGWEYADVLKRSGTLKQKLLHRDERYINADRVFCIKEKDEYKVKCRNVIIIDDVITSGASTSACAYQLKQAGATKIYAAAPARTEKTHYSVTEENTPFPANT